MTRLTQRDQIVPIVSATFTQRPLMMNLFCRHDDSTIKTQLTKGMLRSILVTDPLPCTTISFLRSFISAVLFIVTVDLLLMLRAEPSISKIRTARITARSFRFLWHCITTHDKGPEGFSPSGPLAFFIFAILTISHRRTIIYYKTL